MFQPTINSNGSKAGDDFVCAYQNVVKQMAEQERQYVDFLEGQDIKAAHPLDGWVDMTNDYVQFIYPYFRYAVEVGDKVALGYSSHAEFHLVEIIRIKAGAFGIASLTRYYFKRIGVFENPFYKR